MSNSATSQERPASEPKLDRALSKLRRDMDQLKRLYQTERRRLEARSFKPRGEG